MHDSKSEINVYFIDISRNILSYNNSLCCRRIILVDGKANKSAKKFEAFYIWGWNDPHGPRVCAQFQRSLLLPQEGKTPPWCSMEYCWP